MPQAGTPEMKARVPSMGSMIQDQSLAPGVKPSSSPWIGLSGQARPRPARISASTPRSAAVTGSKAPGPSLFSTSIGWRKCASASRPASSTSGERDAEPLLDLLPEAHVRLPTRAARSMDRRRRRGKRFRRGRFFAGRPARRRVRLSKSGPAAHIPRHRARGAGKGCRKGGS